MRGKKAQTMPGVEYHRPALKDYQLAALFHDKRYAFIEGTTKAGKTISGLSWLVEEAINGTWTNYWWVAPVYSQAKIAYERAKRAIPELIVKANESDLTITIIGGHVLWFKSAEKPDNLFGEDVGAALLDECSRMREEAWYAIRTTLTATRGKIRCIGNVKGRQNWFFRLCRRAESGDPDMVYAKITAADAVKAGILTQEEIDDAKRILPEAVFNELYYAIPNEDGSNPFGISHIKACVAPISTSSPVCFGIDLAKSIDWTVIVGLDHAANVCLFDRWQSPWQETINRLGSLANGYSGLVDSTGVGDPVLEQLQRAGKGFYEGYKFTSESKQKLMEGLAIAIQSRKIKFPDGPIRIELENFEYEYTRTGVRYTAPEGMHDDCVMAIALAWQYHSVNFGVNASAQWESSDKPPTPEWE
jgi:hypothetical protein